jgi:hypothetical protein
MRVNVDRNLCPYLKIVLSVHAVCDFWMSFVPCYTIAIDTVQDVSDITYHYTGLFLIY